MLKSAAVYNQPSSISILANKFVQYLRVGWMLHIASVSGVLLLVFSLNKTIFYAHDEVTLQLILWLYLACFGFVVFVVSVIDGYGRFQNYKQTKDLFYKYGFDARLIKPFTGSRCQRNAVMEAGRSANNAKQTKQFFSSLGYKWYHIFPDAFVKNPLVLFTKIFWKRILVTKHYKSQYFYW